MDQYLPILLILLAAAGFGLSQLRASQLMGPSRPTGAKAGPYESGIVPRQASATRFPVRFYLVAMIFIIFDIEVVFLYPWAVMYHQLGTFGLAEMAVFVGVVFVALAYLISNGALDWGPAKRLQRTVDLTRTTATTVRRVRRFDEVEERAPEVPADVPVPAGAAAGAPGVLGGGAPGAGPAGVPEAGADHAAAESPETAQPSGTTEEEEAGTPREGDS